MGRRRNDDYDEDDFYGGYYFAPSKPRRSKEGIKARSQKGNFARNWWANRWIAAMEQLVDAARLGRGRNYARQGQVLSIEETADGVKAKVQGSRRTPYAIKIKVSPLSDTQWEQVIDVLASKALFTAQLLAGEMPMDIEEAFTAAGSSLFPDKPGELVTECSCPDWSNPCKHVAATHYILAERFDEDPFLLFRLRGRTQEQILAALRQRRSGQEPVEVKEQEQSYEHSASLETALAHFWEMREPLEPFAVSIKPPTIELPVLKRLGEPSFWSDGSLESRLTPAYQAITRAALDLAFGGDEPPADEPSNGAQPFADLAAK